jgi:hypothetical protein
MNEANTALPKSRWSLVEVLWLVGEVLLLVLGPANFLVVLLWMFTASNELDQWLQWKKVSFALLVCQVYLLPCVAGVFYLWRRLVGLPFYLGSKGVLISVGGSAVAGLLASCAGFLFVPEHEHELRLIRAENAKATMDLRQLADECIAILKDKKPSPPGLAIDQSELPPLLASLRPVLVDVRSNSIQIVLVTRLFAGGEDYQGFWFTKRTDKHVYELEWFGEYDARELLLTLPIEDGN